MIYHATEIIDRYMNEVDQPHRVYEHEDGSFSEVRFRFPVPGGPTITARAISTDNDNDVAIRVFGVCSDIPIDRRNQVRQALNDASYRFRFFKFVMDKDADVIIQYDLPSSTTDEAMGPMVDELICRLASIIRKFYPLLMKAIFEDAKADNDWEEDD